MRFYDDLPETLRPAPLPRPVPALPPPGSRAELLRVAIMSKIARRLR